MSTLATTNLKNPTSLVNSFVLNNDGSVTVSGLTTFASGLTLNSTTTFASGFISSGVGSFSAGSATTPSIAVGTGTTNKPGIYSPGTDQVAISTNGTGRLFVDSTGQVGLGVTPAAALHILTPGTSFTGLRLQSNRTTGNIGGFQFLNSTSTLVGGMVSDVSGALKFETGGSFERLRITETGLVGIGTTSPGALVDSLPPASTVVYRARSSTTSAAVTALQVTPSDISAEWLGVSTGPTTTTVNAAANLLISISGTERARIDSSGRLLVGTSSSSQGTCRLLIQGNANGAANAGGLFITRGDATPADGVNIGVISFADSGQVSSSNITAKRDGGTWTSGSSQPTRLEFSTTADGASSPTERMRIRSDGRTTIAHANNTDVFEAASDATSGYTSALNVISFRGYAPNNTAARFIYCGDNAALRAEVRANGGLANYQANNVNLSDRNTKKDISAAAGTWDCIKEWEIVNYRYKDQPDDADLNLGVIAQQVAESCPEVITVFEEAKEDQPEKLGVKEQQMYWMAIKAFQEAQVRIEQLEAKVAALESE